jgi:hypothetical protein
MAGATDWVRRALAELGPEAPDADVKAYIREKASDVPESYVSLVLGKLRRKEEEEKRGQESLQALARNPAKITATPAEKSPDFLSSNGTQLAILERMRERQNVDTPVVANRRGTKISDVESIAIPASMPRVA